MKNNVKKNLCMGLILTAMFMVWTALIQTIDVRPVGQNGTDIGFAGLNVWFHELTGVHILIYTITDWLGLVPVFICMIFACVGLVQLIKRRSLLKVDRDITVLGIYYIMVILGYLIFEMIPINYRPILIDGRIEASYPSSTTLLVTGVMPTLWLQTKCRIKNKSVRNAVLIFTVLFTAFMVIGRTVAGVHWLTDIIGSLLLSFGLYFMYCGAVGNKTK